MIPPMPGVFDELRVLDLSWGIAGPMTTMLLADNGAGVTKIEPPGGDPFDGYSGARVWHRGKRRAALDLSVAEGRDAFLALAAGADVVVESFSPGTTEKLGLGFDALHAANPGLIVCSITGYGRGNPLSERPGYDGLVAARTGILFDQKGRRGTPMEFINGRPGPHPEFDGPEGMRRGADRDGPVFPRSTWPSLGATYLATLGIAAALRAREVTGEGQWVETSLLQGALAAVALNWQRVDNPDAPLYWMWPVDGRSIEGLYECADGRWVHHWTVRPSWVLSAAEGDELRPVGIDTAYRDDPDRLSMEPDGLLTGIFLHPLLAEAFGKFPSDAWVAAAEAAQMGVALVRSPAEALADPSFLADGCVVEVDDPRLGRIRHVGNVLEFEDTPGSVGGPTATPGAHTAEVLAEAAAPARRTERAGGDALTRPLEGVRVLDLGLGVAGPFAPRMLADLGAEVIKLHALHDTFWAGTHMGLGTNRGKRSISLNVKDERGREALHRLVDWADVVATNWRPGAAARLGIDYESLRERHPRLVYCNTRGYEKGPRSDLPGTDQTAAALTGIEWEDGGCDAGNPPMWSRSNMGDTGNALLAAIAITAALYHRDRTGHGQAVSTSIVNAGLLGMSYAWIHADGTPGDWAHVDAGQYGLSPRYRLYECADGWLFLAAVSDGHRAALAGVMGESDTALDDADKLAAVLEARFRERPAADWFAALDDAGVPVEVVDEQFARELFDDPAWRAHQLVSETWAAGVGRFEDPGLLVNLSATPGAISRGPCLCGQHSREILRELGYDDADVDALVAAGVVRDEPV
ncbi:MAG: L-carnitine dehydratase/bile acid-inducible protein [Acidimicrobiales bacterium]|jgi:crotonobetainyl-CoA:carnitine CoA-transferase CaiB-like acyl-CoA transferase|nr:L-carnitine dehydratase/bile acid-inducible protein [Acidimicrobiales bacterium]